MTRSYAIGQALIHKQGTPGAGLSEILSERPPVIEVESSGGQVLPFLYFPENSLSFLQWEGWYAKVNTGQQQPSPACQTALPIAYQIVVLCVVYATWRPLRN
jgi:hypothetical protein